MACVSQGIRQVQLGTRAGVQVVLQAEVAQPPMYLPNLCHTGCLMTHHHQVARGNLLSSAVFVDRL